MLEISGMQVAVGEIQRAYLYKLYIEQMPAKLLSEYKNANWMQGAIDLFQQKGVWPERETEDITVKWAGEFVTYSGVDVSNRKADLEFIIDENHEIEDFWQAAKDLTGNLTNHAAQRKPDQCLTLGVAQVSVDKNTITQYVRLGLARVTSVKTTQPDKGANNESRLTVKVVWDRTKFDKSKRGLTC